MQKGCINCCDSDAALYMCYVIVGLNNAQTFDEDVKDDNRCYVTNEDE